MWYSVLQRLVSEHFHKHHDDEAFFVCLVVGFFFNMTNNSLFKLTKVLQKTLRNITNAIFYMLIIRIFSEDNTQFYMYIDNDYYLPM